MPVALDVAVMCEKIFAAGLGHDEAESFVIVEPFNDTDFCFQCKS